MCETIPGLAPMALIFSSTFHGISKTKDLNLGSDLFQDAFILLGKEENLRESTKEILEQFVCHVYGKKVNDARYQMFCGRGRTTTPDPERIPPTHDSLALHLQRANFVSLVSGSWHW